MALDTFTVISTFSGCGGSSLGYKLAGGKILLAVEWDDGAVETYKMNFPDTPIFHGDIKDLSVSKILEDTGLKVGELDIFDGSPPCQGFSVAGKRNISDSRNVLFEEYCRILSGLKPKVFVMENVSGMVKGHMKPMFIKILQTLKGCGYNVKARVLNAKNFSVPQSRERIFFIGVREDLNIEPSHPTGSRNVIAIKNVIGDCPNIEDRPTSQWLKDIHAELPFGAKSYLTKKILEKHRDGKSGGYINIVKCHPNRPSPTIPKTESTHVGLYHYKYPRKFNELELKRLSSFPDDFKFISRTNAIMRMGNCVPPLFMKAIAGHVRDNILIKVYENGLQP